MDDPGKDEALRMEHEASVTDLMEAHRASPEYLAARRRIVGEALACTLDRLVALGAPEREAVIGVLAAALDEFGAGAPQVPLFYEAVRSDAEWWADFASGPELEAYTAAGLRALGQRSFGLKARKRLMVWLWEELDPPDRRAFLAAVDPAGTFRGKAA